MAAKLEVIYGDQYLGWAMLETMSDICCEQEIIQSLHMSPDGYYAVENIGHLRIMTEVRNAVLASHRVPLWKPIISIIDAVPSLKLFLDHSKFSMIREDEVKAVELRKRLKLGHLLSDFARFRATDSRDKIFALLGLTNDGAQKTLTPQYSESVSTQDVYLDAARFVFAGDDPLCVLPFAGTGYIDRLVQMPSWVPDWSHPPWQTRIVSFANTRGHKDGNTYQTSGTKEPGIRVEPTSLVLSLAIIKVDEIGKLGPIYNAGVPNPDRKVILFWREETHQLVEQGLSDAYPFKPNQSRSEAFWRTLIGDATSTARPAPAILGCEYHTWVEAENVEKSYLSSYLSPVPSTLPFNLGVLGPNSSNAMTWYKALALCVGGRRFCITNKGYMGMVPPLCKPSDLVCIIMGAETPYIIRRSSNDDDTSYEIVGECYIHGMMDGEMLETGEVEQLNFV